MSNNKKAVDKRIKDEKDTAFVFQDFIDTFQNDDPSTKKFIKSGVYNEGIYEKVESDKGAIYNSGPLARFNSSNSNRKAIECAKLINDNNYQTTKNASGKKSNLQSLKEELESRHLERNKSMKVNKANCTLNVDKSTNLHLTNLSPKLKEHDLMQIFGVYGPLASVKIMWPRTTVEYLATKSTNIGFVAYMSRKDSERAFVNLTKRKDMRISWGKPIGIPKNPVFIPPELVKLMLPAPINGLPFNAQPIDTNFIFPNNQSELDILLKKSIIKVAIPLDRTILCTIHRVIEFTIREGSEFEACIMKKERNNQNYQFLFKTNSPNHIYYRWKLFSILHGESTRNWSPKPFRMFKNGPIWIPPISIDYTKGMPDLQTIEEPIPHSLSDNQQCILIQIIQNLTPTRKNIAEAMVFVINHANANKHIIKIIVESFDNIHTEPIKKIARLYLLSDILCNINTKISFITMKQLIEAHLLQIFEHLGSTLKNITHHMKYGFKTRVLSVLRTWGVRKVFTNEFLDKLESPFMDQNLEDSENEGPLDGKLLLKRSLGYNSSPLATSSTKKTINSSALEVVEVKAEIKKDVNSTIFPNFVKSKWETLDPAQLESQAMSSKKLHALLELEKVDRERENRQRTGPQLDYQTLRNIEVKVMKFQEDFETERKWPRSGMTVEEEVNEYRKKCISKYQPRCKRRRTDNFSSPEDLQSKRGNFHHHFKRSGK